ncbi:MAG: site-specific integrase [Solibacillus isronensis]
MTKRTLQRYAANFVELHGIQFSCHVLRHTFATLLLENGVPIEKIQYLMGHRLVTITRHYTQSAFINLNDLEPSVL